MRSGEKLILPNDAGGFVVEELRQRLAEGLTVTMAFGGNSMLPLINGTSDKIELSPVDGPLRAGEIYLFLYQGHCVIHRLLCVRGDKLLFRGDNCVATESVTKDVVLAHLTAIVRADGSRVSCASPQWRRLSRKVSASRTLRNIPVKAFSRRQRQWQRWVYFAAIVVLMWAPLGFLGVPLNNFVFGIRADHLLHASVYIPCVFYMMDFFMPTAKRRAIILPWLSALLTGLLTEFVQYLLPYRGFDINDLVANAFGVTLGFCLLLIVKSKRNKMR